MPKVSFLEPMMYTTLGISCGKSVILSFSTNFIFDEKSALLAWVRNEGQQPHAA